MLFELAKQTPEHSMKFPHRLVMHLPRIAVSAIAASVIVWGQPHSAQAISIKEYPVPTAKSAPERITTGPDGNMWFTEGNGSKIGRITPAGVVTEFPMPTASSTPDDIVTGPDKNLWFTEDFDNKVGRITPAGVVSEFPIPSYSSTISGITAGPDGNLWFTETDAKKIGGIAPGGVVGDSHVIK